MIRFILSLLLIVQIQAFAPRSSASFSPANVVQGVRPPSRVMKPLVVRMSDEKKGETEPIISADGTFYDDQLDSAPVKEGISDSMRERLMREASTGLDSETKQTNVILYICVGVAVLVVLGGQGILY